ncbi:MAG: hypothetical protein JXK05_12095 [Campylobacterales bacterium]|nr:hypothetical protein [Campylobacterales bacterium]
MDERTPLERLSEKVGVAMERLNNQNAELNHLRGEMESKNHEINKLREELALKDMEIEEIVSKIESMLA